MLDAQAKRNCADLEVLMSILDSIIWRLMPSGMKLERLKRRGLTIGGGVRFLTDLTSAPSRTW